MRIEEDLKPLFNICPLVFQQIREKVLNLNKEWDENTFRQSKFQVHSETKSIVFKFQLMGHPVKDIPTYPEWDEWKLLLEPIILNAANLAAGDMDGVIIKAMLANMPTGSKILPHIDQHWTFDKAHRIHLPIITNDQVDFYIDGIVHHLKEGTVYEINNKLRHSVENNGNTDRVHLIFDYVPKKTWDNWPSSSS